jgi:DNA polymerase III sliding clamp (beta) subunit (PCNA family)
MSDKNSINREALARVATLVRPALSTQNYIPALQHIRFDGKYATSYNDISAISVRLDMDVERCLPGELLIRALSSFGAETILFQENSKEGNVVVSSGRSKIKLPTLGLEAFPLTWPDDEGNEIDLDHGILKGIERCLLSVGNDPTHPETMGVTMDADGGKAVLYSTDNFTISRFQTTSKLKLPGGAPVILPTFFCEQLISLAKAFSEEEMVLTIRAGSLLVEFGKAAKLFTKTLVDREPLDFPGMLEKMIKVDNLKENLDVIPDSFDAALGRALLVLGGELDKVTTITMGNNLTMHSSSAMGDADDKLAFDGIDLGAPEEVHVDPGLVARASKVCGLMNFLPKAMILADSDVRFIHLIAYCSK